MRFSASSLNTITKCGYKYYLEKIKGEKEPGRKGYTMLQGNIVGEAIQKGVEQLNANQTISYQDIVNNLTTAYQTYLTKAEIPPELFDVIKDLLNDGVDASYMNQLDVLSECINNSPEFSFKVPPPLKDTGRTKAGYSTDKKRLGMMVWKTLEDVCWFFEEGHPHYQLIKAAQSVESEKYFRIPIGEEYISTTSHEKEVLTDIIDGYLDQHLATPNKGFVFEYKYTKTPYTQQLVNTNNQVITYQMAHPEDQVALFDVAANKVFYANIQPYILRYTEDRYLNFRKMVQNDIYIPACGTDPYTTGNMLCGFKCGGCPFGTQEGNQVEEEMVA